MYTVEDIMKVLNEKECFTAIVKRINPKTEKEIETESDFDCIYYDNTTKDINGARKTDLCVGSNNYGDILNLTPIRNIIKILD